jgi:hypothetical protein
MDTLYSSPRGQIAGAVERIDDPHAPHREPERRVRRLFGEDRILRERGLEPASNDGIGLDVGGRHQLAVRFVPDVDQPRLVTTQGRARAVREARRDLELTLEARAPATVTRHPRH